MAGRMSKNINSTSLKTSDREQTTSKCDYTVNQSTQISANRGTVVEKYCRVCEDMICRKSLTTSIHDKTDTDRHNQQDICRRSFTETYDVRKEENLHYFKSFLNKIEKKYMVNITIKPEQFSLEMTGTKDNVKIAVENIYKFEQKLTSDSLTFSNSSARQYFESEACIDFIHSVEEELDVRIQKQNEIIYGDGRLQVTRIEHKDHNKWTMSENRALFVEQFNIEEVITSVKVIPSMHDTKTNKSIVKGEHIVDLGLPTWTGSVHSEFEGLDTALKQIFHQLAETNKTSVALLLKPTAGWTFDHLMNCTIEFAVKWLIESTDRKPTKVILCPNKENFSATTDFVDKSIENLISAVQNRDEVSVTVCQGELDKTKVDVLVNTASANLDLSRGNVSAALLKTAGRQLQKECYVRYRYGLRHGEIAVTKGYGTNCKNIYHMALKPYSQPAMKDCIESMRVHMLLCLQTASDSGHTSIAFPALGTGSLEYPVEIVAAEMFGCVERFKQTRPQTSLKTIKFVIYHRDRKLFQYFQQVERSVNQVRCSRQIRLSMIGINENIDIAKEKFKTKVKELITLPVKDQGISNTCSGQKDEHTLEGKGHTSVDMEQNMKNEKASYTSTVKEHSGEDKETKRHRSSADRQRKEKLYERSFSWTKDAEHVKVFEINQCLVRVYKGDILNAPVDCIVVANEKTVQHCVNDTSTAGENEGKEMPYFMHNNVQNGAGILPDKCVINADFPCWNNYKPLTRSKLTECANTVRNIVVNCLRLAENENFTSIAFPSISSGNFAVPQDICAIQYVEAMNIFTKEGRSLNVKEIHFIDQARDMVEIIQKTFQAMITDGKQAPFDINLYVESSARDKIGKFVDHKRKKPVTKNTGRSRLNCKSPKQALTEKENSTHDKQAPYISDGKILKCFFPPYNVVEVYAEDILNVSSVEAIVCSVNRNGDAKGMIANALCKKGGEQYRKAKMNKFSSSIDNGDVITTKGGSCGFKLVLHSIMTRKCPENIIPIIYKNILLEAKRKNISSFALPIMGTGCGDMDVLRSAECLLSELINFFSDTKNSQLRLHVHLVLNDTEIASVIKDVFKTYIRKINEPYKGEVEPSADGAVAVDREDERTDTFGQETKEMKDDVRLKSDSSKNDQGNMNEETESDCVICMDKITDAKELICGHMFCSECIEGYFRVRKVCPTCGKVCGVITGDQPEGTMEIVKRKAHLEGYDRYKTLAITYSFEPGKQGNDHPKPGTHYNAITRTAYLPDNKEGREICSLLKVAFERRLVFTIGTSRTTGQEGVITWNDIHHKTDLRPHTQFGYPDATYLQRVREELEVKGVTVADIDKNFLKKLDKDDFRKLIK